MHPLILKQTLEEKDLNKDGYLDFQEFVGAKGTIKIYLIEKH